MKAALCCECGLITCRPGEAVCTECDPSIEQKPFRLADDCRCEARVSATGALIVIADSECDRHRPAILDVQS